MSRADHGSIQVKFGLNLDSTCSGRVGEEQTRNWPLITTGRVGSDSKKWLVSSVETNERQRQAKENETLLNLVGGERNITDLSLNIIRSKAKLSIRA